MPNPENPAQPAQPITYGVRELRVLPLRSAELAFTMSGIIGKSKMTVGTSVSAFDFTGFYNSLGTRAAGDSTTLEYNSTNLYNKVSGSIIMALRAEGTKAVLDKAIGARQNVYWQQYQNAPTYAAQALATNKQKVGYISSLNTTLTTHYNQLSQAYGDNMGVVKATTSAISTKSATGKLVQNQTGTNTGYVYHAPATEMQAAYYRAQISLGDQYLAAWAAQLWLPNLDGVLQNQLAGVDLDIKRLQIAYFNTILISPISGVITAIRRKLGDYAKAGEAVVRIEDNTDVILMGTLVYQGIIPTPPFSQPPAVTIQTTLPGADAALTLTGSILVARSRRLDNQLWDVVLQCDNISEGNPVLPLNFSLEPEKTQVLLYPQL